MRRGLISLPLTSLPNEDLNAITQQSIPVSLPITSLPNKDVNSSTLDTLATHAEPVSFETIQHTYTVISYPDQLADHPQKESILWMRTVHPHLKKVGTPLTTRHIQFTKLFGNSKAQQKVFSRRYPTEKSLDSRSRVKVRITSNKCISTSTSHKRGYKRSQRNIKRFKSDQEGVFRATAALIRYGLLKSGGKYTDFMRMTRKLSKGSSRYGYSVAHYPTLETVTELANAIYKHPDILTNSPDWVIRYRKGRLKIVNGQLVLPTQQLTVSQISIDEDDTQDTISERIRSRLQQDGLDPMAIKVRKGYNTHNKASAAAYVYFNSAYQTRCAAVPLKDVGRVSLGQTIVTSRVVASKVHDVIETLLSEADGYLAEEHGQATLQQFKALDIKVDLQEWVDKDGRVTFIKLKIVDPTHNVFKRGESRVHHLLEYVGSEHECRRFYPILVDQFDECNGTTFYLNNGLPIRVTLTLASGDHAAAWAKLGRSGGHEYRDPYSDYSKASCYHIAAYQDKPDFSYRRHVETRKKIEVEMKKWQQEQVEAKVIPTDTATKSALMDIYHRYGRVERMPALVYGEHVERPNVYCHVRVTPLVLHNQSYCVLCTLELGFKGCVKHDSPQLKKLQGRYKGLVDGIGTTKCACGGTGLRILLNDCLILEGDTTEDALKYAPIWYLMDTVCHHFRIKGRTPAGDLLALLDHERLAFAGCGFCWWALIGDLSDRVGGRKLKSCVKNHLEDKMYGYELVNACPEWEERVKIPLSLVDEAIFEASFAARDEYINSQRSKVAIEGERKIQTFMDIVRALAPKRNQRSIMAGLPRHIRRNIVIRECWRSQPKWSFNLRNGFLRRCARYSYHTRVSLSKQRDIFLDITGPTDSFYTMDDDRKLVVIDPCGQCHGDAIPSTFEQPVKTYMAARTIYRAIVRKKLQGQYATRLKEGHLKRAKRHLAETKRQIRFRAQNRSAVDFKHAYDGYTIFQQKYPQDLSPIQLTQTTRSLLESASKAATDIWDGDTKSLPSDLSDIMTDRKWTVKRLKAVIRYFRLHGTDKRLTALTPPRDALATRAIGLLRTLTAIEQHAEP